MRFRLFYLILWAVFAPLSAWAQDSLYTGEAVVEGQSEAERNASYPRALEQVLIKLTGLTELPPTSSVQGALGGARAMVVSFAYRTVEMPTIGAVEFEEELPPTEELRLVAQFVPEEVDQMVLDLGLQRWPAPRRPLVLYAVVDDGLDRRLNPEEFEQTWDSLIAGAEARGLNVRMAPPLDEETAAADLQLLWGGFTESLVESDPGRDVLIAAARREGPLWNVRMALDTGGYNASVLSSDPALDAALAAGMEQVVEELVALSVIAPDQQGQWIEEIVVNGLFDAERYHRCREYLDALAAIDRVQILSAKAGEVRFRLALNASPEYLQAALERDAVLVPGSRGADWTLQP